VKVFHCDRCGNLVFFENVECLKCRHRLAFIPDLFRISALESVNAGLWKGPWKGAYRYRLCQNYTEHNACNWAVPETEADLYCASCRLTRTIPDLSVPGYKAAWIRLETAKRRLIYTLLNLHLLPLENSETSVCFEFLADMPATPPVLTGHANGVITINIAEANDAERERRRQSMHEPYRTLLGHFRHEVGHYYWDHLVRESRLEGFRQMFGDERADYGTTLKDYYAKGPPADWQTRFISAYASAHPWEDWAETWAHYLHITDTLEIAAGCGLALQPKQGNEPALEPPSEPTIVLPTAFDAMMEQWFSLTYVLNNLNRGMGLPDGYPFVLSTPAIEKLRFVHETIVR
jgi:hypothetical protein